MKRLGLKTLDKLRLRSILVLLLYTRIFPRCYVPIITFENQMNIKDFFVGNIGVVNVSPKPGD